MVRTTYDERIYFIIYKQSLEQDCRPVYDQGILRKFLTLLPSYKQTELLGFFRQTIIL